MIFLVKIFDLFIYPWFGKYLTLKFQIKKTAKQKLKCFFPAFCNFLKKPLQKIVTGGLVLSAAFFVSAALETHIESTEAAKIPENQLQVFVLNGVQDCKLQINIIRYIGNQTAGNMKS